MDVYELFHLIGLPQYGADGYKIVKRRMETTAKIKKECDENLWREEKDNCRKMITMTFRESKNRTEDRK